MIEIKITDPHLMDKDALRQIATFLLTMTGDSVMHVTGMIRQPAPAPMIPPPPPLTLAPPTPTVDTPRIGLEQVRFPHINPFAKPVEQSIPSVPHAAPRAIDPGVELDKRGLPWDNRIHSRTKTKTADGLWKSMRGLNPAVAKSVEAELFQAMSLPPIISESLEAPLDAPVMKPGFVPPPPVAVTSTVDPIAAPQNDFPALMTKITSVVHTGKTTSAAILKIVQEMGLPSLPVVASRPDLIPSLMARIDALVGA